MANVRNSYVGVQGQLGLEGGDQRQSSKGNRTHVEDMKDPVEVRLPSSDLVLVILRMGKSRDRVPLALFHDFPFDLHYGPVVKSTVSELLKLYVVGLTHVISCFIAIRTD